MEKETALLIIDVQVAMFSSLSNTAVYKGELVLNNICMLLEKARREAVPVIFVQHTDHQDEAYTVGELTWQLHPRMTPVNRETVIRKSSWDAFHQSQLHMELQRQGIKKLVIAGMKTEFSLDTSCRRAFSLGYECVLVKDAHTTFDGPDWSAAEIIRHHNRILGERFAKLLETKEITFTSEQSQEQNENRDNLLRV